MPLSIGKVPTYRLLKNSGQAVVRLDGRDHYLGPYGSDESHEENARLIAEWRTQRSRTKTSARATAASTQNGNPDSLTVNEFILRYLRFA